MTAPTPSSSSHADARHSQTSQRDRGQAIGPELIVVVMMALVVWGALSWLGRLTQTGQRIENAAQSAARVASQQPDPTTAGIAAANAVTASNLDVCADAPTVDIAWTPSTAGTWLGGSVTATITCTIDNSEPFASAGRTISATDTQVVDQFRN